MPFENGKYIEYSSDEAAKIHRKTIHLEKKPRLERHIRPGEVASPLDFAVKGDIFPMDVIIGKAVFHFENRAEAEEFLASAIAEWEKAAEHD